jgi:nitrite reductase/ring-hydroxylating ferredoxin subunit
MHHCRGRLDGYTVEGPLHFAIFDVRTGEFVDGPNSADVPTKCGLRAMLYMQSSSER